MHFINTQLTPSDEVGIISYSALKSLVLHEYLTADRKLVRKVVESFGLKNSAERAENLEEQYWREVTGENPVDASKSGGVFYKEKEILTKRTEEIIEQFRKTRAQSGLTKEEVKALLRPSPEFERFDALGVTRHYALNFIQKMKDLAGALRYIPGYKHIILFSSGLPHSLAYGIQSPFGNIEFEGSWGDSLLRQRYENMLKELAASNSKLYTLDTEDLATKIGSDIRMTGVFSLQNMANATGGKYFGNINNYENHLEKIQTLTGCYYVLGYYIDEKWDGRYHEIRVKVRRPGSEVHAQRGYFNRKPFTEYNNLEKMLHLVDLALSERPLFQTPLSFPLVALPCSIKGKTSLALYSTISAEKIQDVYGKKAEIVSIIFDNKDNIVKIERDEVEFSKLPKGNLYYSSLISLPPGEYKSRLVLRNLETGKGAVASASVIIPKDLDYGIKLYPPLLLKEETGAFYVKEPSSIYPFDKTRYSPLVEELEEGTKTLLAMVRCSFSGIQQPDVKLSANLIHHLTDSSQEIPVTLSILDRYMEGDAEIFFIELQTEGLSSGEYFLYLFTKEMNAKSLSQVNISFKVK